MEMGLIEGSGPGRAGTGQAGCNIDARYTAVLP